MEWLLFILSDQKREYLSEKLYGVGVLVFIVDFFFLGASNKLEV